MKLVIVSIRDIKADRYMSPQFLATVGGAIRAFGDEINRQAPPAENPFYHHPEDFEMFVLGHFDDETGLFDLLDRPQQIAVGSNMRR